MFVRLVSYFSGLCLLTLLTGPTAADPPFFPKQNRTYQTYAAGYEFEDTGSGFRQVGIDISENYDVKGIYESSFISISEFEFKNTSTGFIDRHRFLSCQVAQEAIFASRLWMTAAASLDTGSPACFGDGTICTYDFTTGDFTCQPYGYEGVVEVEGLWDYASISSQNAINRRFTNVTSGEKWVTNCQESIGDGMRVGGFSINDLFVPFSGLYGNTFSFFQIYNCNQKSP